MKVLVTGATGFVGSCLTRRLVSHGYDVHIFRRQSSPSWRLVDLMDKLTCHDVDLRDAAGLFRTVRQIRPDVIFHLATFGGFAGQNSPADIINTNLLGVVNLLGACEEVGYSLFVNTGSSSEYGHKGVLMQEANLLEPVGSYGVAKAAATMYCRSEAVTKGLPIVTLRLFSPYGPWDDPRRLIPYVIASLLRGESPRLAGPNAVRDFIFIDDVIDVYLQLLTMSLAPGAVYNVGSGRQYRIGEVVQRINELVGNGIDPVWGATSHQRPEPDVWCADITRAGRELTWQPGIELGEGLLRTIAWMDEHRSLYAKTP